MAKQKLTAEQKKISEQKKKLVEKSKKLYAKEQFLNNKEKSIQKREEAIKAWEANDEQLTKAFFIALGQYGGHRGLALNSLGLARSWFRKKIATDEVFRTTMQDTLEDSEDFVQGALFNSAMNGNSQAALAYMKLMAVEKTKLDFMANNLNIDDIVKEKTKALDFVVRELFVNYNTLKQNGRDSLAMMALKQIAELLRLNDISDFGEVEILRGTDLIKLLDGLNIKPDVQDINFDLIDDEEVKKHYADMLPQQRIEKKDEQKS